MMENSVDEWKNANFDIMVSTRDRIYFTSASVRIREDSSRPDSVLVA